MCEFLRNLPVLATKTMKYSYELSVDSSVEYKPFLWNINIQYILVQSLVLARQSKIEFSGMVNSRNYARHKVM